MCTEVCQWLHLLCMFYNYFLSNHTILRYQDWSSWRHLVCTNCSILQISKEKITSVLRKRDNIVSKLQLNYGKQSWKETHIFTLTDFIIHRYTYIFIYYIEKHDNKSYIWESRFNFRNYCYSTRVYKGE